jgi:hypothetical protein
VAHGVHAAVEAVQVAAAYPPLNAVVRNPALKELVE